MAFDIGNTLSNIGGGALNAVIIIIFIIVVCSIVGALAWSYFKSKRYKEYTCIIWSRNGFGQLQQHLDHAGVFMDRKTNNIRLFLKNANVGLCPDDIPSLPGSKGQKYIYLYRKGLKNFFFLKPDVQMDFVNIKVGEEDVNWAVNSYEKAKKLFTSNMLLQYMPFIALALVSIIILVMFIYFFKDFKVLKEVAQALQAAAEAMRSASAGTTIIPAG
jgi:hypothetical protein